MEFEQQTPTDETASITEGMVINGDIQTTGSLDLVGRVTGNIQCLGKLNVTGEITGDSEAAEIYAEAARITGEVKSKGSVKVGQSTVIVGNIFGSSAVIAGAVKGDIDVHGPVVLDTTAIVMGNIKSQSVQINNGAVIEGMCSQAYADVNPSEFFEGLKNK
ncbi:MAG: polymer-forming cytoskeletal protein [Butyrivibrio sp.]|nr:polymer-forming cytoskeletal protein [Butyrivibrio sp.]